MILAICSEKQRPDQHTNWARTQQLTTTFSSSTSAIGLLIKLKIAIHCPRPDELIGRMAIHGPRPYELIGDIAIHGPNPHELKCKLFDSNADIKRKP